MRPAGVGVLKLDVADEIDAGLADAVARYCAAYPEHSIEMTVSSPGGDFAASVRIFRTLKNHRRRVMASIQRAASGGALIVMAADVRHLDADGFFFLHRPAGPHSQSRLDEVADELATLMADRCRVPAARFRRWMDETTTIDARHAVAFGLAHSAEGLAKPRHPTVFL